MEEALGVLWILEVRKRKEKLLKMINIPFIVPRVIKLNGSDCVGIFDPTVGV